MAPFLLPYLRRIKEILPGRLRQYRWLAFFVAAVGIGMLVWAGPAAALDGTDVLNAFIKAIAWLMLVIAQICIGLTIFFLRFFISIASYNNYIDVDVVQLGWIMVRDVANMFFVVALLVIAFGTILGLEEYEWKKNLVKLVLAAIFINFSNLIAQLIIDVAHVFTITFLNAVSATAGGNLINMFKLQNILSITGTANSADDDILLATLTGAITAVIFSVMAAIAMGSYVFVMASRVVVLWALIILSPLAYLLGVLPKTKSYADRWWSEFGKHVIVAPVMVFFLWLSFATLGTGDIITDIEANVPKSQQLEQMENSGKATQISLSDVTTWENMANFILALAFMIVGLKVTQETGAYGSGAVSKAVDFGRKVATIATGYAAGRWLVGKGQDVAAFAGKGIAKGAYIATLENPVERFKMGFMRNVVEGYREWRARGPLIAKREREAELAEGQDLTVAEKAAGMKVVENRADATGKIFKSELAEGEQLTDAEKAAGMRVAERAKRFKGNSRGEILKENYFEFEKNDPRNALVRFVHGRLHSRHEKLIKSKKLLEKVTKEKGYNEELMDKRVTASPKHLFQSFEGIEGVHRFDALDRIEQGMVEAEKMRSAAKTEEFSAYGKALILENPRFKDGEWKVPGTRGAKGSMIEQIVEHKEKAALAEQRIQQLTSGTKEKYLKGSKGQMTLQGRIKAELETKAHDAEAQNLQAAAQFQVANTDVREMERRRKELDDKVARGEMSPEQAEKERKKLRDVIARTVASEKQAHTSEMETEELTKGKEREYYGTRHGEEELAKEAELKRKIALSEAAVKSKETKAEEEFAEDKGRKIIQETKALEAETTGQEAAAKRVEAEERRKFLATEPGRDVARKIQAEELKTGAEEEVVKQIEAEEKKKFADSMPGQQVIEQTKAAELAREVVEAEIKKIEAQKRREVREPSRQKLDDLYRELEEIDGRTGLTGIDRELEAKNRDIAAKEEEKQRRLEEINEYVLGSKNKTEKKQRTQEAKAQKAALDKEMSDLYDSRDEIVGRRQAVKRSAEAQKDEAWKSFQDRLEPGDLLARKVAAEKQAHTEELKVEQIEKAMERSYFSGTHGQHELEEEVALKARVEADSAEVEEKEAKAKRDYFYAGRHPEAKVLLFRKEQATLGKQAEEGETELMELEQRRLAMTAGAGAGGRFTRIQDAAVRKEAEQAEITRTEKEGLRQAYDRGAEQVTRANLAEQAAKAAEEFIKQIKSADLEKQFVEAGKKLNELLKKSKNDLKTLIDEVKKGRHDGIVSALGAAQVIGVQEKNTELARKRADDAAHDAFVYKPNYGTTSPSSAFADYAKKQLESFRSMERAKAMKQATDIMAHLTEIKRSKKPLTVDQEAELAASTTFLTEEAWVDDQGEYIFKMLGKLQKGEIDDEDERRSWQHMAEMFAEMGWIKGADGKSDQVFEADGSLKRDAVLLNKYDRKMAGDLQNLALTGLDTELSQAHNAIAAEYDKNNGKVQQAASAAQDAEITKLKTDGKYRPLLDEAETNARASVRQYYDARLVAVKEQARQQEEKKLKGGPKLDDAAKQQRLEAAVAAAETQFRVEHAGEMEEQIEFQIKVEQDKALGENSEAKAAIKKAVEDAVTPLKKSYWEVAADVLSTGKGGSISTVEQLKDRFDRHGDMLQFATRTFKKNALDTGHEELGMNQDFDEDEDVYRFRTAGEGRALLRADRVKIDRSKLIASDQFHTNGVLNFRHGIIDDFAESALSLTFGKITKAMEFTRMPERSLKGGYYIHKNEDAAVERTLDKTTGKMVSYAILGSESARAKFADDGDVTAEQQRNHMMARGVLTHLMAAGSGRGFALGAHRLFQHISEQQAQQGIVNTKIGDMPFRTAKEVARYIRTALEGKNAGFMHAFTQSTYADQEDRVLAMMRQIENERPKADFGNQSEAEEYDQMQQTLAA
ncbi:MAG: hypothetical protein UY92_C0009G0055 [Candidatus Magasanikbacteria bacterium GW2011_GWA2_56_11]|uniref:Uncharacterized protein n=1 Tax=Candidatus Magasanikbacteria bacterium GW2011_GWA2_56_11 TaxID=1619044 RepID=A0A0G1YGA0_9BACT|nr:MAG: hypothetical protein UY92_C0009G0055 [Candidatus Magasanikbacteria bacterium GW2011_GWA2_56_11]